MLPKNSSCPNAPWWNLANAAHGHEIELDQYDTNGTTLLKQVKTQYQIVCISATEPTSGYGIANYGNWNGHLVSELDKSNPVAACEV